MSNFHFYLSFNLSHGQLHDFSGKVQKISGEVHNDLRVGAVRTSPHLKIRPCSNHFSFQIFIFLDFTRMFHRYNVTINFPASHPTNSLSAMRLLAATPDSNTSNIRQELSHALFSSYWIENKGTVSKIPKVAPAPRE